MHDSETLVGLLESELPSTNEGAGLYLYSLFMGLRYTKLRMSRSAMGEPGAGLWRSRSTSPGLSSLICKMRGMMVNFMFQLG